MQRKRTVCVVVGFASILGVVLFTSNRFNAGLNVPSYKQSEVILASPDVSKKCLSMANGTFIQNDGKPLQLIVGQVDYFRIPPEYWDDRLQKAKAAGLDAIQFYVPWNFHEIDENRFEFGGNRDVVRFIRLIAHHELLAIVRIGPYICAEWTFGGLPPWLLYRYPDAILRSSDSDFMGAVNRWFALLLPRLKPLLCDNDGPIIMIQIENEYGVDRICDHQYMLQLHTITAGWLGNEVLYYTTDQPVHAYLSCTDKMPDTVLRTIDFGPCFGCEEEMFRVLDWYQQKKPLFNSEYYTGWIDHVGKPHHVRNADIVVSSFLRQLEYSKRVSVAFYVFHGGSNFGFWNGANSPPYIPQITSYDYDAPISEAGDIGTKFIYLQNAIHKFKRTVPPAVPQNTTKTAYGTVTMKPVSHLLNHLENGIYTQRPLRMEMVKQYEGYLVYSTPFLTDSTQETHLSLDKVADVAHIYTLSRSDNVLNYHATLKREFGLYEVALPPVTKNTLLLVLVENTGYINYGPDMSHDRKGISPIVHLDKVLLTDWTMYPLCLNPDGLYCPRKFLLEAFFTDKPPMSKNIEKIPAEGKIYHGTFQIDSESDRADTFIRPISFNRGLIYVNSHHLGRYDLHAGPQLNLYLPKTFLRVGRNYLVIVEMCESLSTSLPSVQFDKQPRWKGSTEV